MRGFRASLRCAAFVVVALAVYATAVMAGEQHDAGYWSSGRMSLGLRPERWRSEPMLAPRSRKPSQCSRWRAAASRLGETYAGHVLRQTVIPRECRFLDADRADETWDWPRASLSGGRVVPPRLHATFGAWEIRCGSAGARRRCALLHRDPIALDHELDAANPAIVTHFVIDVVGGRESLLWRMFVPIEAAAADSRAATRAATRSSVVRYRLHAAERSEPFPACTESACLMEANIRHAGEVATHLWDGKPLDLHIWLHSDRAVDVTLPAAGFRAGLKELVRLRREEVRAAGKR
jgi:invasion protein IalB